MTTDRKQKVRAMYDAFAAADRGVVEDLITDDFTFHAPPDPHLDRAGYFERCWPGAGTIGSFEFVRLIEAGDEVVITYESTRSDGGQSRNTEIMTFEGDRIRKVEVYFGWDVLPSAPVRQP